MHMSRGLLSGASFLSTGSKGVQRRYIKKKKNGKNTYCTVHEKLEIFFR